MRSPRSTRKQSSGPGTAPIAFCRNRSRSATAGVRGDRHAEDRVRVTGQVLRRRVEDDVGARRAAAAGGPATRTCCRPRPAAAGRPRPPRRATVATVAAMSTTLRCGFDGVSNQTSRVRSVSASQSDVRPGREVDVAGVDAGAAPDPLEVAERPAVDVVADDDLVARRRRARRWPRSPPTPTRTRSRARRPRAPRPPARAARASGSASARTRSRVAAGRRRPGRRSRSGRSAARPRRSARRARRRRGRPACRRRAGGLSSGLGGRASARPW